MLHTYGVDLLKKHTVLLITILTLYTEYILLYNSVIINAWFFYLAHRCT